MDDCALWPKGGVSSRVPARVKMNSSNSRATNFTGSWDEVCPHCGSKQETHRQILGDFDGEILEHRMPCEPEKETLRRKAVARVRTAKVIILIFWILLPLSILILEFMSPIVGAVAFGLSLIKLGIEVVKFFGNPDKWIPGHKANAEKQRRMDHYFFPLRTEPRWFRALEGRKLRSGRSLTGRWQRE